MAAGDDMKSKDGSSEPKSEDGIEMSNVGATSIENLAGFGAGADRGNENEGSDRGEVGTDSSEVRGGGETCR